MRAALLLILLAGCASDPKLDSVPMVPVAACMAAIDRLKEAGDALSRKYDQAQDERDEAQKSSQCNLGRST